MAAQGIQAQDAAAVQTGIKRLDAAAAQMKACGWASPLLSGVVEAERGWAVALLASGGLEPDATVASSTGACGGEADMAARTMVNEVGFTWIARTVMYSRLNRDAGWSRDLFTLSGAGTNADALLKRTEQDAMTKIGTQGLAQLYDSITRESQYEAALVCPQRGEAAKGGGRACPAVAGVTPEQSKLALRRAELIEKFAGVLAAFQLPTDPPPAATVAATPAPAPRMVKYRTIGIMEYMNNTMTLKFSTPTVTFPCKADAATIELPEGTGEFVKQTVEVRYGQDASGGATVTGHVWGTAFIVDTVNGNSPAAEDVRQNFGGGGDGGIPMVKCY